MGDRGRGDLNPIFNTAGSMASQLRIANPQSSLISQIFRVDRETIGYLRFTLESYDGMAMVTTRDPYAALIEVFMSPGCVETVLQLLEALRQEEGLHIETLE